MSYDEIGMVVNSDFNVPLNHLIWLQDYKTYGEDSYVFNNKDILHELYRDYSISMCDLNLRTETSNYANTVGELGLALSSGGYVDRIYVDNVATVDDLHNITDIDFCREFYLTDGSLRWITETLPVNDKSYSAEVVDDFIDNGLSEDIASDALDAWYNDAVMYARITSSVDEAMRLYNIGGSVWSKCKNQTYLKDLVDAEMSAGNLRTSTATIPSSSDSPVTGYGNEVPDARVILGMHNPGSGNKVYVSANITEDGTTTYKTLFNSTVVYEDLVNAGSNLGSTKNETTAYCFHVCNSATVKVYFVDYNKSVGKTADVYVV